MAIKFSSLEGVHCPCGGHFKLLEVGQHFLREGNEDSGSSWWGKSGKKKKGAFMLWSPSCFWENSIRDLFCNVTAPFPLSWIYMLCSRRGRSPSLPCRDPARGLALLDRSYYLICMIGTSLVAQWLRIRLPMQGTQVRALVQEAPTCHRATKPVHHNYWARTLEPSSHN